jgi:hypothetical protein
MPITSVKYALATDLAASPSVSPFELSIPIAQKKKHYSKEIYIYWIPSHPIHF